MGYAFVALVFLGIYFVVKSRIDKKIMLSAAKNYADKIQSQPDIKTFETRFVNQDICYYRLDLNAQEFKALTKGKTDISIQNLDYKNLVRFKNLFDTSNDIEYFQHNGFKHLIYPIISDGKRVDLILLERPYESINDIFLKNKSKRDY